MPAQLATLGETKVRLLAAYVLNLSAKSRAAGTTEVTSNAQLATHGGPGDVASN
jgi:hypothetical protein